MKWKSSGRHSWDIARAKHDEFEGFKLYKHWPTLPRAQLNEKLESSHLNYLRRKVLKTKEPQIRSLKTGLGENIDVTMNYDPKMDPKKGVIQGREMQWQGGEKAEFFTTDDAPKQNPKHKASLRTK